MLARHLSQVSTIWTGLKKVPQRFSKKSSKNFSIGARKRELNTQKFNIRSYLELEIRDILEC